MSVLIALVTVVFTLATGGAPSDAVHLSSAQATSAPAPAKGPYVFSPPTGGGPVVVSAHFDLQDVNSISDRNETFEFVGVLTLTWTDPRQVFDPQLEGTDEKFFTGDYQFNEISPGWYPQIILVNESGLFETSGVLLRVRANGTSTLVQSINATAKAVLSIRRFPFDSHQLDAVFAVIGHGRDEVVLEWHSSTAGDAVVSLEVPQWTVTGLSFSTRELRAHHAGPAGIVSALVLGVSVARTPFAVVRLVVLPLVLIVLLSFSVFWMDRSSLGDRIAVSFIGILTCVAYLIVVSDILPPISYFTLMHGFLNLSLLTMSATVVINLVVGALDRRGRHQVGNLVDRRCRWIFPCCYFGLCLVMAVVAWLFFE